MDQLFTNPELVYEVIQHLDYPNVLRLCLTNCSIQSICLAHPLVNSLVIQKYVDYYIEINGGNLEIAFRLAIGEDNVAVVDDLLRRGVDPSTDSNAAIVLASAYGNLGIVDRLLSDPRVDPSARKNRAIIVASEYGHYDIVDRLLFDPRVDPSARDNQAIVEASKKGYLTIVERLLSDDRVRRS